MVVKTIVIHIWQTVYDLAISHYESADYNKADETDSGLIRLNKLVYLLSAANGFQCMSEAVEDFAIQILPVEVVQKFTSEFQSSKASKPVTEDILILLKEKYRKKENVQLKK